MGADEAVQIIIIDFVFCLPRTLAGYDNLLTVTDKFSKRVLLIPGKKQATAEDYRSSPSLALYYK